MRITGRIIEPVFYVYLFSAVAGCLLVGVSMGGGLHGDGDGDAGGSGGDGQDAGPALSDGNHSDHALMADGSAQQGLTHGGHGHGTLSSGVGAAAMFFFSLQLWTYLLAFGGLTGLLLRLLAHVPEPTAGLCALGVGLGTAVGARKALRRLSARGDSGTVEQDKLIGTSAQVVVPAEPGATGKVRLVARGQTIDMLARTSDGRPLLLAAEVIVLDIKDGVADVSPESLDAPPKQNPAAVKRASLPQSSSSDKG